MADTTERFQVLETSELFADIPSFARETILSSARLKRFEYGQLLFVMADPIKETFLLLQGCAMITQHTRDGGEIVLRIIAPGELVGDLGRKPGSIHPSTARALQECEALVWPAETFEAAVIRFPILRHNIIRILQRRIADMENRICRVSTQHASDRVASELVRLSNQIGQKVNSHVEIKIPQEALARMAAMNLWTLNRVLGGLEDQGFVRVRRMCIEVHDSPGLCMRPGCISHKGSNTACLSSA